MPDSSKGSKKPLVGDVMTFSFRLLEQNYFIKIVRKICHFFSVCNVGSVLELKYIVGES